MYSGEIFVGASFMYLTRDRIDCGEIKLKVHIEIFVLFNFHIQSTREIDTIQNFLQ